MYRHQSVAFWATVSAKALKLVTLLSGSVSVSACQTEMETDPARCAAYLG